MNILKHRGYYAACDIDFQQNQLYAQLCFANFFAEPISGDTPEELKENFEASIDEYLQNCAAKKVQPAPPFAKMGQRYTENELLGMMPAPWVANSLKAKIIPLRKFKEIKNDGFQDEGLFIVNIPLDLCFHLKEFLDHSRCTQDYLGHIKEIEKLLSKTHKGLSEDEAAQKMRENPLSQYYLGMRLSHESMMVESARIAESYPEFWREMLNDLKGKEKALRDKKKDEWKLNGNTPEIIRDRTLSDLSRHRLFLEDAHTLFQRLKKEWLTPTKFDDEDLSGRAAKGLARDEDLDLEISRGRSMSR